MNPTHVHADHAAHAHEHDGGHGHGTRRGYLIGFALAAVLTAVPFWAVMSGALGTGITIAVIFGFAFVQMVVHAIYFLHLDTRSEGGWTLVAFVFTVVLVAITIAGSIWIMYHLDMNMMPMAPGAMGHEM
jgi:cytochrome o ubiquinol oxidase subunit IV